MRSIFTLTFLLTVLFSNAQIKWNFDAGQTASSGIPPNMTVGVVTQGNNFGTTSITGTTTSSSGYYTGASGANNIQASAKPGALDKTNSTYFTVTLTPSAGYSILISGISF